MDHQPELWYGIAAFGMFILLWLTILAIIVGSVVLQIWMLIDCVANETNDQNQRVLWTLIIYFLQGFGALLYLLIRRPKRKEELGQ